ncbi:MAG: hypothetical protein J0M26_29230 [Planctomycetes bacterium]|nr:hypothetical protein [Planctomycetota bacterium]
MVVELDALSFYQIESLHTESLRLQEEAIQRGDVVTQIGYGSGKFGAHTLHLAGGIIIVEAGASYAVTTSTYQSIASTTIGSNALRTSALALNYSKAPVGIYMGYSGYQQAQTANTQMQNGDYIGVTENVLGAGLNAHFIGNIANSTVGNIRATALQRDVNNLAANSGRHTVDRGTVAIFDATIDGTAGRVLATNGSNWPNPDLIRKPFGVDTVIPRGLRRDKVPTVLLNGAGNRAILRSTDSGVVHAENGIIDIASGRVPIVTIPGQSVTSIELGRGAASRYVCEELCNPSLTNAGLRNSFVTPNKANPRYNYANGSLVTPISGKPEGYVVYIMNGEIIVFSASEVKKSMSN